MCGEKAMKVCYGEVSHLVPHVKWQKNGRLAHTNWCIIGPSLHLAPSINIGFNVALASKQEHNPAVFMMGFIHSEKG